MCSRRAAPKPSSGPLARSFKRVCHPPARATLVSESHAGSFPTSRRWEPCERTLVSAPPAFIPNLPYDRICRPRTTVKLKRIERSALPFACQFALVPALHFFDTMGRTDGKRSKTRGRAKRSRTIKTYIAVKTPAPPIKGQYVCDSGALSDPDDEEHEETYVCEYPSQTDLSPFSYARLVLHTTPRHHTN
ncbi:hypothetical protein BCR44DRAFT_33167 [Catenaria anguillulae PL171]|uniref:Uncharacterized protein n=1 Tax=Catenaria anguillulae PL171 TaxID=765915 RepID=A0A1Y2HV96_9FUNG|nr:hypothetical protein BCR44DRAFT_33167 [Catenaria anguillulae PL171]